jgi:membrane associated rhomboid family serine protease
MSDARTMPVCYRHPDRPTYLSCSECGRHICPDCSHDAAVGQKCPECVRGAGKQRVVNARNLAAAPSLQTSPVVFSLIAINVVIYLIGFTSSEVELEMLRNYAAWSPAIEAGEWWRGLTAAFLHGGTMHIMFNMYFLYIFGPRLERQVGSVAFSGIYLASAAGGSVATYLFGPGNALSVGASGALFGLFGAWLYAAYRQRGSAAGSAMFNQLGAILLINMALPLFIPNIDWRAHLGGLATGIVVAFLWEQVAAGRSNARQMRAIVAFAALAVLLAVLAVV